MNCIRLLAVLCGMLFGLNAPAYAQATTSVDLCNWFAAMDFNQAPTHYSKKLTRMCRNGEMHTELAELRRITIEIQMQRFIESRSKHRLIGQDTSISRTGFYLIAQQLGILRAS